VTTKVLDIHPQNEKVRGSKIIYMYIYITLPNPVFLDVLIVPCTICDDDASRGGKCGGVVGKGG